MRLFSYSLRVDDGAAPNPYGGVCTLAICKPMIRKHAKNGDWIVGLGSKNSPDGRDLSRHIVYAMLVTSEPITFDRYDEYCRQRLPIKLPAAAKNAAYESIVGDCIYFERRGEYLQRESVHYEGNMRTDLSGKHVLLSEHFLYFGDRAIDLPGEFHGICHPYQGHKVNKNESIKDRVAEWLEEQIKKYGANGVHGSPLHKQVILTWHEDRSGESVCSRARADDDESDPSTIC